ncbi:hypothetical protein [Phormidium sp. CCY1219]|uniref:hypothetical protein n=1 Tax=Phormidium sp. CCY1219 TaxID=2886104 RepID=UPI002D1F65FC|nr:hypothetical protein [Phormidium sp. CCY1219]MEB3826286.1 hypothetical protein [Phormidium sp. CCY1219]
MRPDLQDLPITSRELKRLSGVDIEAVIHFSFPTLIALDSGSESPFFIRHLPHFFTFIIGLSYGTLMNRLQLNFPASFLFLLLELFLGIIASKLIQFFWVKKYVTQSLPGLIRDVERFNGTIKAIDINDRLEEAGNPDVHIQNREQVIEALQLTREDLIRALKTEKILRKNRKFIARNPEIFANNLTALTALQVSDRATEHGRLLNEALQIALSANQEMGKISQTPEPTDKFC